MPQVCVGPEFEVDPSGRLRLELCGNPAELAWPYPCPPAGNNPLRIDPDCGLWLPPYPKIATAFAEGETSSAQVTVPAGFTEIELAEITVTNPSACQSARVIVWINVDVDFYIPAGADARAGARINGNSYLAVENPAPAAGTDMTGVHWEFTQTLTGGPTVAAGGTQTYAYPIDAGSGQGGAQYGQVRWQIRALVLAGLT